MIFEKTDYHQKKRDERAALKLMVEEHAKSEVAKTWKPRFAWWPVRISVDQILWLESYEVRFEYDKRTKGGYWKKKFVRPIGGDNYGYKEKTDSITDIEGFEE